MSFQDYKMIKLSYFFTLVQLIYNNAYDDNDDDDVIIIVMRDSKIICKRKAGDTVQLKQHNIVLCKLCLIQKFHV